MKKNQRPYQILGNQLKELIISGGYPLGSRFMPERDIAEHFQVSRAIVREALIMLELEGLVEVRKGSGVYIIQHPEFNEESIIESGDFGPFEVLQARQVIESAIAACAALHATKSDILEMKTVLNNEKESLQSIESGEENDHQFHILLARSSQNGMMLDILESMWNTRLNSPMWDKLHEHIEDFEFRKNWLVDHERILHALQKRDPELARKEMWQHLENVKQTLLQLSDFDDPNFDGYLFESIPYSALFETKKES